MTDVDAEVLREMLRYMYTGTAPNVHRMVCLSLPLHAVPNRFQADELLAAADKYQLERLKASIKSSLLCQLRLFAGHVRASALYWIVGGERM